VRYVDARMRGGAVVTIVGRVSCCVKVSMCRCERTHLLSGICLADVFLIYGLFMATLGEACRHASHRPGTGFGV